jgi:hypothetical protein
MSNNDSLRRCPIIEDLRSMSFEDMESLRYVFPADGSLAGTLEYVYPRDVSDGFSDGRMGIERILRDGWPGAHDQMEVDAKEEVKVKITRPTGSEYGELI